MGTVNGESCEQDRRHRSRPRLAFESAFGRLIRQNVSCSERVVADHRRSVLERRDVDTGGAGRLGTVRVSLEPFVERGLAAAEVLESVVLPERLGAPVAHTWDGHGAMPTVHPLSMGVWWGAARSHPTALDVVGAADLVLGVGVRAGTEMGAGLLGGKAPVVLLDATDDANPKYVRPAERVATFDQDGTLWVEQPVYTQVLYCLERVPEVVKAKPELANVEPFKTVLSGDRAAIAKLPMADLEKILVATLTGMTTDEFSAQAGRWIADARNPRWKRPYTDLVYQPMLEVMQYLRTSMPLSSTV